MISTGIVRRIDELGRVVIPKELRRTLHIKEGEEMEVKVGNDGDIVLKKFSQVKLLKVFAQELCEIVGKIFGVNALVCDMDKIIASSKDKALFINQDISKKVEECLLARKNGYWKEENAFSVIATGTDIKELAITPIIFNGDIMGGVLFLGNITTELLLKVGHLLAMFLSKQIEE